MFSYGKTVPQAAERSLHPCKTVSERPDGERRNA